MPRKTILPFILLLLACGGVARLTATANARPANAPLPPPSSLTPLSPPPLPPASFPRLGMWWPNPWEQPLADIARYDWVILGDYASEFIDPLKTLHPDLLLLTSSNACELGYNPDPEAELWENAAVRAVPYQWFLTQVGTVLSVGVDATQTVLPVEAITVTDGVEVYPLFVVSDTVLIEGESAFVEAVDPVARTLTVQRGYVRPASAHAAGTRIAAHITFWPNSWLLNVSTLSPQAVISPTVGLEIWPEYNARLAAGLLADPRWDGILLDRSDANESWLIGNSTARTIDPDQSNTLPDDYAAFDAAWNAGLRLYEGNLRQAVGAQRIIFVNWGMPNYDLLNGNNFEGFPREDISSYGAAWSTTVFGPWPESGSYVEWLAQARQPNLTMVETYEDDSGPDPTSSGGYDNPCDDPGFTPDYRKMRFGLATALLGDGYFSYEINTNGHGSLCLLWFDEYDNAGAGRGYLGIPLGPAQRALPSLTTPDLLAGGDFEDQAALALWDLWADDGYAATLGLDTTTWASGAASARVNVTQSQGVDWQVSFSYAPVEVISATEYTLSFWAKAEAPRLLSAWVQQNQDPWSNYAAFGEFSLTAGWQHFEVAVPAQGSDPQAVLVFGVGNDTGQVWLDGVKLQTGSREIWRRDFSGGVVLVNVTSTPQTIPLGSSFRKIAGNQVPQVNDGSLVDTLTLPPHDGLILLRPRQVFLPMMRR